jgi:hypothetical protein
MMIALVMTSGAIAGTAATAAIALGWGPLASALIYCLGGALTLLLLAALVLHYARPAGPSGEPDKSD